jgi:putative phage-type endonuclease
MKRNNFKYNNSIESIDKNKLEELREQVKKLREYKQPEQRTEEWYNYRNTMITASDWATVLGKNSYSSSNRDLLLQKVTGITKNFSAPAVEWGKKYEPVANKIYEKRNNVEVIEFGCLRHPIYEFLGASPDGITEDGIMLEIKCPISRVITGIPPDNYWIQVQGQLEVCDLDQCDFLECKIVEYDENDEEDIEMIYLTDNYEGDYTLHSNGMEKGIIAVYLDKNTDNKIYKYSELGIINDEYYNFIENQMDTEDLLLIGITYWYLDTISCQPINRDKEWFKRALPDLKKFWQEVEYYKNIGPEILKKEIEEEKLKRLLERQNKKQIRTNKKYENNLIDNDYKIEECLFDIVDIRKSKETDIHEYLNNNNECLFDIKDIRKIDHKEKIIENSNELEISFSNKICLFDKDDIRKNK